MKDVEAGRGEHGVSEGGREDREGRNEGGEAGRGDRAWSEGGIEGGREGREGGGEL